jgi:cytidylate kinase
MSNTIYYRITITGDPGSGKTTFARNVAERTGFKLITTGNMFRALAKKKGITVADLNELAETQKEIDREVDDYIRSLNNEPENLVLDSRMAWHFIHNALKVRLTIDQEVAVERIYNDKERARSWDDHFPDLETAMKEIQRRKDSEVNRYRSLYGVDIGDDNNFDLVINTSHKSQEDVLEEFEIAFNAYKTQQTQSKAL